MVSDIWQGLLNGIGSILAWIYGLIANYGLSIVALTLLIKLVLLPLGIKQIKSMQHMQAIQPKIKELQKKYKNNKQKQQEETMRLYKEAGVNPLGGCLPLLLQFPILIAMYQVLRTPIQNAEPPPEYSSIHFPVDSELYEVVTQHETGGLSFLFMNLQCSLVQAGEPQPVLNSAGEPATNDDGGSAVLDCGESGWVNKIPYVIVLIVMIGSTYYQQQQMQKASPAGSQSSQQQAIMKVMPLMFLFFGLSFPAGLLVYWTTSNLFQIGQQWFLMRAGHIGPDALEKRMAEQRERAANGGQQKEGLMTRLMAKAEDADRRRDAQKSGSTKPKPKSKPGNQPRQSSGGKPPAKGTKPAKGAEPGNQLGKKKPKGSG